MSAAANHVTRKLTLDQQRAQNTRHLCDIRDIEEQPDVSTAYSLGARPKKLPETQEITDRLKN